MMRRWMHCVAIGVGATAASGCLGLGDVGQPELPPAVSFVSREMSAGGFHACVLASDTRIYCWGLNSSGQLGDQTAVDKSAPTQVAGNLAFRELDAGSLHTCAITTAGEAFCWGSNQLAQLGIGQVSAPSALPLQVMGDETFVKISAGGTHTCGLTQEGAAFCWGSEESGQLGNGETGQGFATTPEAVLGGLTFRSISAGAQHTCGVTTDAEGYCWGRGASGRLGAGSDDGSATPVLVSGDLMFSEIGAGDGHTCGVTTDLEVYCWGDGQGGQLGTGQSSSSSPSKVPFELMGLAGEVSVTAGGAHTCAVLGDETRCWGRNDSGQLGDGSQTDRNSPELVMGGLTFAGVSSSLAPFIASTCGITVDNSVYCWGAGSAGQLGNGASANQSTPVKVLGQP